MGSTCCTKKETINNTIDTTQTKPSPIQLNEKTQDDNSIISSKNSLSMIKKDRIGQFISDFVKELNLLRRSPAKYCDKIRQHMIYIHKYNIYCYDNPPYPKISLVNGESSFKDCINALTKLESSLSEVELRQEIAVEVPTKIEEMNNKTKMAELLKDKRKQLNMYDLYRNIGFHYDNASLNAEASLVLQLVDDNNSNYLRRLNLINPNVRYIGISVGKINSNRYILYFTFAT